MAAPPHLGLIEKICDHTDTIKRCVCFRLVVVRLVHSKHGRGGGVHRQKRSKRNKCCYTTVNQFNSLRATDYWTMLTTLFHV
jgi:hypothetical protein